MKYKIYYIADKNKVGLAKDLEERVERQQGYTKDEYDVIGSADKLEDAREIEKMFIKKYNCRHESGMDLIDMSLRKSFKTYEGATITFPVKKADIGNLIGDGVVLTTLKDTYELSKEDVDKLFEGNHFYTSKFDKNKTYCYVKIIDNLMG